MAWPMGVAITAAALVGLAACSVRDPAPPAGDEPVAAEQRGVAPFALFPVKDAFLTQLETPLHVPVAGTPSPQSMHSDDPAVVSIADDGALVAHKYGSTLVHGTSDPALRVEVREVHSIAIQLDAELMSPRQAARVVVLADDKPVPNSAIAWDSSNASVARVDGEWIHAGGKEGDTLLTARLGDLSAHVSLRVQNGPAVPHRLLAPPKMALGQIQRFELQPSPTTETRWSTTHPAVLAHLGGGFFNPLKIGSTQVCATITSSQETLCQTIEVAQ